MKHPVKGRHIAPMEGVSSMEGGIEEKNHLKVYL